MRDDYEKLKTAARVLGLDARGEPAEQRLRVCVVALLWEMAYVDGRVVKEEFEEIIRAADHEFHLMDPDSVQLIEIADFLKRENDKLNEFIAEVNERFDQEQRQHLYDLLWRVAEADRIIHPKEEEFREVLLSKLKLLR